MPADSPTAVPTPPVTEGRSGRSAPRRPFAGGTDPRSHVRARGRVPLRPPSTPLAPATLLAVSSLALLVLLAPAPTRADASSDPAAIRAAWTAVAAGDAVVVMRHALAPGTGDPADFDVEDCSTQRNLSDEGREQARRIGERLARAVGTREVAVFSSAWCRCLETARLLALGAVTRLPPLDSFFRRREREPEQSAALGRWIARRLAREDAPPAALVTHQVNITALTGVFPASGEMVIVDARGEALARVVTEPY